MAGKGDIKAGRAFVELYLKGGAQVARGLRSAQKSLQSFGSGVMALGGMMAGVGTAIGGALAAAVAHFVTAGSELADMAARTGIAAGELAALKFAAEQSGASLSDVESGVRKMQKTLGDATKGSKSATDALAALGFTVEDLQGLSPEEQFSKIGKAIADIKDPTAKAAAAMSIFGKSGTNILPMLQDMEALKQEAKDLGIIPTEQAIQDAAKLGDLFDKLKSVALAAFFEIGAAFAPILIPALEQIIKIAAAFNNWAKTNGEVIRTVAKIAAGLIAAGAVVTAIGAGIFALGSLFGAAATVVTTLTAVIGALLTPIGLVVAGAVAIGVAIGGAAAYWLLFTDSGKTAVAGITAAFAPLIEMIKKTFGGIGDALMSGELQLAAKIAAAGIQSIFAAMFAGIIDRAAKIVQGLKDKFDALPAAAKLALGGSLTSGALGAGASVLGSTAGVADTIAAGMEKNLTDLRQQAADAKAKVDAPKEVKLLGGTIQSSTKPDAGGIGGAPIEVKPIAAAPPAVAARQIFSTFSASALSRQGGGASPQKQVVNKLAEQLKAFKEQNRISNEMLKEQKRLSLENVA